MTTLVLDSPRGMFRFVDIELKTRLGQELDVVLKKKMEYSKYET